MPYFYLKSVAGFFGLRVVSVLLHYLGPSPWGGTLALSPGRFLPEALLLELLILNCLTYLFFAFEQLASLNNQRSSWWRAGYLFCATTLCVFAQVDFEVVRWLGQHMSLSYIQNFAGARDGQLFARILSGDRLFSSLAALQIAAALAFGVYRFWSVKDDRRPQSRRATWLTLPLIVLVSLLPFVLRPSDKRWRRVRPASVGLIWDATRSVLGIDRPRQPVRAHNDLVRWVHGHTETDPVQAEDERYPLLRDDNVGQLTVSQFKDLPAEQKPDVVLIVFETLRGMNSGLLTANDDPLGAMPELARMIRQQARYFPRVHSAGYPSVEGALGMHLGIWPHFEKIIFSSYLHIPTWAFPEMLRQAGYQTFALLGADPSFSNFTPWFRRWYRDTEFSPQRHHDGPLVDRFIELHQARQAAQEPQLLTLWTATTHPPYDVPAESGVKPALTNEQRYVQAMHYADQQITRLVKYLQSSPRWDRTLLFVLGDHSQPTPWQWRNTDHIGELNPGHTWTSLAIFGGGAFAPERGRCEQPISHINLAPTILAAVNLKHKNHFFGDQVWNQTQDRDVVAFRYGTMFVERGVTRSVFRVAGGAELSYAFNPNDVLSYAAEEGGERQVVPATVDLDRYRDMARAWGELLDEGRVAPQALP